MAGTLFEDVKSLKNVILRGVKDHINILALCDYLTDEFSEGTILEIRAQITQNGAPNTAFLLFQRIGQKPSSFITFVAALKLTKQTDTYTKCLDLIRKKITRPGRADEIINDIVAKEQALEPDHDHRPQNEGRDGGAGNGGGGGGGNDGRGDGGGGDGGFRGGGGPGGNGKDHGGDGGMGRSGDGGYYGGARPRVPIQVPDVQRPTSEPGVWAIPPQGQQQWQRGDHSSEVRPRNDPVTTNYPRNIPPGPVGPSPADNSIDDLKSYVSDEIAEELQKVTTGSNPKPLWKVIVNSSKYKLELSRKDTRNIEKSDTPGQDFLDVLGERGYTVSDLENLFHCTPGLEVALQVLQQHRNEVVMSPSTNREPCSTVSRESSYEENDLNQTREYESEIRAVNRDEDYIQKDYKSLPPDNRLENVSRSIPPSVSNRTTSSGNIPNLPEVTDKFGSMPGNGARAQASHQHSVVRQAHSDPSGQLSVQNADVELSEFQKDRHANQQAEREVQSNTGGRMSSEGGSSQYQRCTKSREDSYGRDEAGTGRQDGAVGGDGDESVDTAMKEIEDVPMKGTRPITAVGDPEGVRSTPNTERELEKLRGDRVSQHDNDTNNLGSFNDVQKEGNDNQSASPVQQTQGSMRSHEFISNLDNPAMFSDVPNPAGQQQTTNVNRLASGDESTLQTGSMPPISVHHATGGDTATATQPVTEYNQSVDESREGPSAQFAQLTLESIEANMPASEVFRNAEQSNT